jgi:hypothetical protein
LLWADTIRDRGLAVNTTLQCVVVSGGERGLVGLALFFLCYTADESGNVIETHERAGDFRKW